MNSTLVYIALTLVAFCLFWALLGYFDKGNRKRRDGSSAGDTGWDLGGDSDGGDGGGD